MMWLPDAEQVIAFHKKIICTTGGAPELRSYALLESAILRAQAGFGDQELYPSVVQKTAAVCCGLVQNHAFVDGNKRIGVATLLLILKMNGISLQYSQPDLVSLGLGIAIGKLDVAQVAEWIESH